MGAAMAPSLHDSQRRTPMRAGYFMFMRQLTSLAFLLFFVALAAPSPGKAQAITADINVKLRPVVEKIDLVTDINVVDDSVFICTQPGLLLRKSLASHSTTDFSVFLDLRGKVGTLGTGIPSLPGLGYPTPGTYDERGLLGFAADPEFRRNGRFWVWYTNINEHTASQPNFFQWLVSTSDPWNMAEYNHVGHLEEYQLVGGVPNFQRTLLKIKRPYFNHTGFQSLVWSPELNTLVLGLGDGGSEYDPNNIAQDDNQLSGKLLKIDLNKLSGKDFTNNAPVATFSDLKDQHVPNGAFTPQVKGLRNPSKVHYEATGEADDKKGDGDGQRWIKYLANTGQDTIEWIHGFDSYGLNFGFRPWEGIFPTSFEEADGTRVIAYGLEASRLPNYYRPLVEYTHLDPVLGPNANTGSALYWGNSIPGLKGQLVFTDWISFVRTPKQGLLMHAAVNRNNLQEVQQVKLFNVDLSEVGLKPGEPIFYTSINTNGSADRIFVGGFKDIQFIVNQRNNPLGSNNLAGGLYEVIRN
jgi:hypothetical protein